MRFEADHQEAALLRYAQEQAATWGAERFAAEYLRRDLEERWREAAQAHTTPYTPGSEPETAAAYAGPVDAAVQDATVGIDTTLRLSKAEHARHPSVPRPPATAPATEGRRLWGRRHRVPSEQATGWTITPAEAAGMSAAGRRLYGLDDPND